MQKYLAIYSDLLNVPRCRNGKHELLQDILLLKLNDMLAGMLNTVNQFPPVKNKKNISYLDFNRLLTNNAIF